MSGFSLTPATKEKGVEAFLGGLQERGKLNYTFYSQPPSVLYNSTPPPRVSRNRSAMQEGKGPAAELVTDHMVGEWKPSGNFPGSLAVRGQSLCLFHMVKS